MWKEGDGTVEPGLVEALGGELGQEDRYKDIEDMINFSKDMGFPFPFSDFRWVVSTFLAHQTPTMMMESGMLPRNMA